MAIEMVIGQNKRSGEIFFHTLFCQKNAVNYSEICIWLLDHIRCISITTENKDYGIKVRASGLKNFWWKNAIFVEKDRD